MDHTLISNEAKSFKILFNGDFGIVALIIISLSARSLNKVTKNKDL